MRIRARSLWHLLALLAWAAQLLLPVAHAAGMARAGVAGSAWCGEQGAALQAELRRLPAGLQAQLDPASHVEQLAQCLHCCAALSAPAHALPQAAALPGRETAAARPVPLPARRVVAQPQAPPPPARGPPASI